MRRNIYLLFFVFISITCSAQSNYTGRLGYGVSPLGHPDFSQFGVFLQEVSNTCNGGVVYANGSWRDDITKSGNIPNLNNIICQLQPSPYNYVDMVNCAWATYPELYLNVLSNPTNNWTNSDMKTLFLQMLINTADSLHPAYVFIGNEISMYWEQDSLDYLNWVSFYNQAYDSIKAHSPNSKVGTTFNFEHLSGNGILTGWSTPYWNAFDIFDTSKLDIIGLTVYPFFNYQHANDVPLNYLAPIFSRIGNKPVVIAETGWPGDSLIGSWYASSLEQVNYVNKIFNIISGRNVEVVNWLFLNYWMEPSDSAVVKLFKSVALRDSLGNDRPALAEWLIHCNNNIVKENNNSEEISIYPNPFSNSTTLEIINNKAQNNNYDITIFDVFGKTVYQSTINKSTPLSFGEGSGVRSIINLNLPNGMYLLQIKNDNFIQTKKLEIIK